MCTAKEKFPISMQFTLAIDGKYLTISSTQKVIGEAFPVDKYMFKVKKKKH